MSCRFFIARSKLCGKYPDDHYKTTLWAKSVRLQQSVLNPSRKMVIQIIIHKALLHRNLP